MKINIIVKPNAKENKITKVNNLYKVSLKAKPIEGKANLELIKFLSKHFKKKAKIISGFNNKKKLILLEL